MLNVFIGYDPRQPLAFNVLQHSILRHASEPVRITPLVLRQLPLKRRGLTEFTFSRFLVPWLCGFTHQAVFMDADMVVTGDVAELFQQIDLTCSVQVMQDQPRFEWASMMLFNNGKCRNLTPENIENPDNGLFDLAWADKVGTLPPEWNHCVGYTQPRQNAKLYHFTQGIPCWYETDGNNPEDAIWTAEYDAMNASVPWKDLMGKSVHAKPTMQTLFRRLTAAGETC